MVEIDEEMSEYADDQSELGEVTDTPVVGESAITPEDPAISSSLSQAVQLVSFCEDELLKNDALFIDNLSKLLQTRSNTSNAFIPHLNAPKVQYINARRSVKK